MGGVPRDDLAATLTPTLPAGWRVITRLAENDDDDRATTLRLSQLTIRRIPAAPRSRSVEVVFEAVVTVPGEDRAAAEDRLDDELMAWLVAVTRLGLSWTEFVKTQTSEGRLGYRGELTTAAVNDRKASA